MGLFDRIRNRQRTAFITVNSHKCIACWDCYNACPQQVFGKIDFLGHRHIKIKHPDSCIGCNKCIRACQHGAITAR